VRDFLDAAPASSRPCASTSAREGRALPGRCTSRLLSGTKRADNSTVAELRAALEAERRTVLVRPWATCMAGHLSLIDIARSGQACGSRAIFVNQLQFAPHEIRTYPRTFERMRTVGGRRCDVGLRRAIGKFYPEAQGYTVHSRRASWPDSPKASTPAVLCRCVHGGAESVQHGAARDGGIRKKDYQQLLAIRGMVGSWRCPSTSCRGNRARCRRPGLVIAQWLYECRRARRGRATPACLGRMAADIKSERADWAALENEARNS